MVGVEEAAAAVEEAGVRDRIDQQEAVEEADTDE